MNPLQSISAGFSRLLQGSTGFATPDVSKTQVIALGQAIIAVLVVFGFDLDDATQQLIIALSGVLAVTLPISDAVLRSGRAKNLPQIQEAQQTAKAEQDGPPQLTYEERRALWALIHELKRTPPPKP